MEEPIEQTTTQCPNGHELAAGWEYLEMVPHTWRIHSVRADGTPVAYGNFEWHGDLGDRPTLVCGECFAAVACEVAVEFEI